MQHKIDWLYNRIINIVAFSIGVFHLLNASGILVLSTRDIRISHLVTMLVMLFLMKASSQRFEGKILDKAIGFLLAIFAAGSGVYMLSRWQDIAMSGGETEVMDAWVGVVVLALVFEAARRGVGWVLATISLIFFTYPFYSVYLPGIFEGRGYGLVRMSEFLTTTSQGVYGIPLGVSATYIILFAIYGAFLTEFGAGEFFFKIAQRITKNMLAAGAKTAVIFSTLLGMISGSAAGNVAVTGTLTIPMMKKEGYKAHQAGAIEAVVSTGGQLMPPVMGAAAFIMAEVVGTPYTNIMSAALIPALLFFASLFFIVHLQAKKSGLKPLPLPVDSDETTMQILLNGIQFVIPFGALIGMIMMGYSPFKASFASIVMLLICHVLWARRINKDFFVKSARAITSGAKSIVPIAIACAAAGIIAGTLGITGLGSKISSLILTASGGIPFFALLLTMVTAIILGMGLPTTAAYLILATVVAPALAKMGVPLLTAHMFVFFYGCVSTITPPVALASYVAASIAKADINKVGWTAFFYGSTCYILPFMFFFGPGLMMQGDVVTIIQAASTGLIGVFCISACVVGQAKLNLKPWQRVMWFVTGILLLHQGNETDLVGFGLLLFTLFFQKKLTVKL